MVVQRSPAPPLARGGAIPPLDAAATMNYVYVLQSEQDHGFYIGFTTRLPEERLVEHQNGLVDSTRNRRPMKLIYFEAYADAGLARKREQHLKDFGSAYTGLLKRLGLK
ncbi:MAG: putative endonuclease [Patescibacteria group bacterium]|nr:putative endonuclease [Patescibacteria group bacterium]